MAKTELQKKKLKLWSDSYFSNLCPSLPLSCWTCMCQCAQVHWSESIGPDRQGHILFFFTNRLQTAGKKP